MLTDRGKLLLVAAIPLWLVSRSFGIREVAMAAVAGPALLLVAVVYTRLASAQLATRRRVHPSRLFYDAEGSVTLDVRNEGRLATAVVQVEDEVSATLADPPRYVLPPIPPGKTVRLRYDLHARLRGRYRVGPAHIRLRDPFGVAQRDVRFERSDEVIVYPPVWALPPVLPRIGRTGTSADRAARPLATHGEFANVREYVRGDDLRKVHWKTTARRGKLMVKQEESHQETTATVVVDTRRSAHHGVGPQSTFEHAVAAAASGAYHLAERGYALRLVQGPVGRAPGSLSWRLVLEHLAVLEQRRGESFVPVWRKIGRGAAGDGLLLAIVPPPDPEELREIVRAGRAFAAKAAVVVTPPGRGEAVRRADAAVAALRGTGWHATAHGVGDRLDRSWQGLAARPGSARAGATVPGVPA